MHIINRRRHHLALIATLARELNGFFEIAVGHLIHGGQKKIPKIGAPSTSDF